MELTKEMLLDIADSMEDGETIDINELARELEEAHDEWVEELEERQHASGFYAFQDELDMWRRER